MTAGPMPAGRAWMGLVLQLVETGTDCRTRSIDVIEISRPRGGLRDIADLGLTLPEAKPPSMRRSSASRSWKAWWPTRGTSPRRPSRPVSSTSGVRIPTRPRLRRPRRPQASMRLT